MATQYHYFKKGDTVAFKDKIIDIMVDGKIRKVLNDGDVIIRYNLLYWINTARLIFHPSCYPAKNRRFNVYTDEIIPAAIHRENLKKSIFALEKIKERILGMFMFREKFTDNDFVSTFQKEKERVKILSEELYNDINDVAHHVSKYGGQRRIEELLAAYISGLKRQRSQF